MDPNDYDIWAMRIHGAIRVRGRAADVEESHPPRHSVRELLLEFGEEASAIAGAIGRNIESVEILGADRHGMLEGFLDEMMKFDDFSFLEYRI